MRQGTTTEALNPLVSKLKEAASQLFEAYILLPAAIDKEHRAIRAHDFQAVQATGEEKAVIADRIEAAFLEMGQAADKVAAAHQAITGLPLVKLESLSDCVRALEDIIPLLSPTDYAVNVTRYLTESIQELAKNFATKKKDVQPEIEKNKRLLETMIESYRESYRFWQEIAETVQSSYNAQGVQKAEGRNSGFTTRA